MHTSYVDYRYPEGLKKLSGSASAGYSLKYATENVVMDLFFQPDVENTIDQAASPLNFTTYERSHGILKGSIVLNGKKYKVRRADGHMDHMIPVGDLPWPMNVHGWNCFEVTTGNYQAVAYAVRSLSDSYGDYSYKHLTLLSRRTEEGNAFDEYLVSDMGVLQGNN